LSSLRSDSGLINGYVMLCYGQVHCGHVSPSLNNLLPLPLLSVVRHTSLKRF